MPLARASNFAADEVFATHSGRPSATSRARARASTQSRNLGTGLGCSAPYAPVARLGLWVRCQAARVSAPSIRFRLPKSMLPAIAFAPLLQGQAAGGPQGRPSACQDWSRDSVSRVEGLGAREVTPPVSPEVSVAGDLDRIAVPLFDPGGGRFLLAGLAGTGDEGAMTTSPSKDSARKGDEYCGCPSVSWSGSALSGPDRTDRMKRVTGIGGVFFKSHDPPGVVEWYRTHLGIEPAGFPGFAFQWKEKDRASETGYTVWSAFEESTDYFSPSSHQFMVNFRVADLPGLLATLRSEGVEVVGEMQEHPNGKFAWVLDPEGRKVELWEPVPSADDPYLG